MYRPYMYEFCKENIKEINFVLISKIDIDKTRKTLKERFEGSVPVFGKRSFHQYVPLSEGVIAVKRCSEDTEYLLKHDLPGRNNTLADVTNTNFQNVQLIHSGPILLSPISQCH